MGRFYRRHPGELVALRCKHLRQTTVNDAEFKIEVHEYLRQTADLALPVGDHCASFSLFAIGVLSLVRKFWPTEGVEWIQASESRRKNTLSMAQWRDVQRRISTYRDSLGEPYGMNESHSDQAAISFLFALAIGSPEASGVEYTGPHPGRLLDEFSTEFIEHFGRSREVLSLLKAAFHINTA